MYLYILKSSAYGCILYISHHCQVPVPFYIILVFFLWIFHSITFKKWQEKSEIACLWVNKIKTDFVLVGILPKKVQETLAWVLEDRWCVKLLWDFCGSFIVKWVMQPTDLNNYQQHEVSTTSSFFTLTHQMFLLHTHHTLEHLREDLERNVCQTCLWVNGQFHHRLKSRCQKVSHQKLFFGRQ